MMFRSRHELREMRLLELTLEADYERNKLLAEDADTREQKVELMSKAEEAHDTALEEYEALREKLPTALRKLTAGYELRCFGFEIFECVRKVALVGLPVCFTAGSPGQLVLGLLTCFMSYGVYMALAPYTDPNDDKLAQFTQIAVFVALVSKVVLDVYPENEFMARLLPGMILAMVGVALAGTTIYGVRPKRGGAVSTAVERSLRTVQANTVRCADRLLGDADASEASTRTREVHRERRRNLTKQGFQSCTSSDDCATSLSVQHIELKDTESTDTTLATSDESQQATRVVPGREHLANRTASNDVLNAKGSASTQLSLRGCSYTAVPVLDARNTSSQRPASKEAQTCSSETEMHEASPRRLARRLIGAVGDPGTLARLLLEEAGEHADELIAAVAAVGAARATPKTTAGGGVPKAAVATRRLAKPEGAAEPALGKAPLPDDNAASAQPTAERIPSLDDLLKTNDLYLKVKGHSLQAVEAYNNIMTGAVTAPHACDRGADAAKAPSTVDLPRLPRTTRTPTFHHLTHATVSKHPCDSATGAVGARDTASLARTPAFSRAHPQCALHLTPTETLLQAQAACHAAAPAPWAATSIHMQSARHTHAQSMSMLPPVQKPRQEYAANGGLARANSYPAERPSRNPSFGVQQQSAEPPALRPVTKQQRRGKLRLRRDQRL